VPVEGVSKNSCLVRALHPGAGHEENRLLNTYNHGASSAIVQNTVTEYKRHIQQQRPGSMLLSSAAATGAADF
jgi:hypothetical protein